MSGKVSNCTRCYRPGAETIVGSFQVCSHCDAKKKPTPVRESAAYKCETCGALANYDTAWVALGGRCAVEYYDPRGGHTFSMLAPYTPCRGRLVRV